MAVQIKKVAGRAQLRKFITYPEILYKDCPNWVPALIGDEFDTLNPKRNAAFEYCDADCFLAYRDGKIAGRVAAIVNKRANELWSEKVVRFGWLDFIEDKEVLTALIDTVAAWGLERGCDTLKGPLGFTDMDKEGLLVEGYENLCPFTCLYNYPYYDTLLKEIGFSKEVDWTQKVVKLDGNMPPMFQLTDAIRSHYGLHMANCRTMAEANRKYGMDLFHMYNESFAPLFQFCPLTDKQIKRYLQTYIPILNPKLVAICLNPENKPIGFAFCVPSLANAVKKSRGRLFPFGFIRILKALRKNDTLEALMIGVLPEYQGSGATVLMFKWLHENALKFGIKRLLLNPQLEENFKVQTLFEQYEVEPYMRRRAYIKKI